MTKSAIVPSGGPPPKDPKKDPKIEALEMQIAAGKEANKSRNKTFLIVMALLAVVSIAIGLVNWGMEGFKHVETLSCMELRKTQPTADCGTGFKPSTFTPQASAKPDAASVASDAETVYVTSGEQSWSVPSGGSVRVCVKNPLGLNIYPRPRFVFEGGTRVEEGNGLWHIHLNDGECGISKKGGTS